MSDLPVLPYADATTGRSSGWSGSDTSAERAHSQDADGTTGRRQRMVLRALGEAGERGATWTEIAGALHWHHGQASGALSTLHKAGRISRLLLERRGKCAVYVLDEYVGERPTAPHGRQAPPPPALSPAERVSLAWLEDYLNDSAAIDHLRVIQAAIERLTT